MKILSLDLATKTGWSTNQSGVTGGVWNLKPKRGSSEGMKQIKLRSSLQEIKELLGGIDLIVYEKPAGRFMAGVISVAELVSVVKMFCEDNKIDYTSYRPTEVKKFATGKGNANKDLMLSTAIEKWPGVNIIDDNMADSMWMLEMAMNEYS